MVFKQVGTDTVTGAFPTRETAWLDARYAPLRLAINAQTGTSYTLVLTDEAKLVTLSNAAAITLTVPSNSSVAFPIGTQVHLAQLGAGQVTVVGDVGVTVNGAPGPRLTDQYSTGTLIKRATETWLLVGRLSV